MATALSMGRQANCDIEVPASQASRQHARVEHLDGGFVPTDHSTNGTYIRFNGGRRPICTRIEWQSKEVVRASISSSVTASAT